MARPTKAGVEYFPLDVQFDTSMKMLICNKGVAGLGVIVTIWQLTYQDKGYYLENNKDLPSLIKSLIGVEIEEIKEIIFDAIERGIFDKELFKKYNILTSRGVQKRYISASKRKKNIEIIKKYFIVDFSEISNAIYLSPTSKCIHHVNIMQTTSTLDGHLKGIKEKEEEEVNVNVNVNVNKKLLPKTGKKESIQKRNFNLFWKEYPKKKSKGQAEKIWDRIKPDQQLFEVILLKIQEAKNSKDWQKQSGQFIPHPATWLNAKGWEDVYDQKQNLLSDAGIQTAKMLSEMKFKGEK